METIYYNITVDRNARRKRNKQRRNFMIMRVLLVVLSMIILFGMVQSLAKSETPASTVDIVKVKETNQVSAQSVDELLSNDDVSVAAILEAESQKEELQYTKFIATAYCGCSHCCGKWASKRGNGPVMGAAGVPLVPNVSVAIDNSRYKFGTEFTDQNGHVYIAADTGSGVKGNHIDVYFSNHQEAVNFGKQTVYLSVGN